MTIIDSIIRREPLPTSDDDGCAQCGKDRQPHRSRNYGKEAAQFDPFCSRSCCEKWHGIIDGKGAGREAE